jgi:hypothetical protein
METKQPDYSDYFLRDSTAGSLNKVIIMQVSDMVVKSICAKDDIADDGVYFFKMCQPCQNQTMCLQEEQ